MIQNGKQQSTLQTPQNVCPAIKTKVRPMMTMLSGAAQRPLVRSHVYRPHSIAELAEGATRCFVPELVLCKLAWQTITISLSFAIDLA